MSPLLAGGFLTTSSTWEAHSQSDLNTKYKNSGTVGILYHVTMEQGNLAGSREEFIHCSLTHLFIHQGGMGKAEKGN